MQESISAKYPSDDLRVYTVWLTLPMGGIRELWDDSIMPDPRTLHFWDTEAVTGRWFAREGDGYNGLAWDVYYLYGPEAEWDTIPTPLVASGGPVIAERHAIEAQVEVLLAE